MPGWLPSGGIFESRFYTQQNRIANEIGQKRAEKSEKIFVDAVARAYCR
jgi:hypothetical protein